MAEASAAPGAKTDGHRRRYLVDRGFQLKYALLMALAGLVVAWFFFHLLGEILLALPSSFHEGTLWQVPINP